MTEPALLVLGASLYQLPVIRAAKARGVRVVTTDNVPANPGHALADVAYSTDTTDAPAVLEIARRERITGVIAACTDVAVPTAAAVASDLGLRGPSPRAAEVLCDKERFRAWQVEQGLPTPPAATIASAAEPQVPGPPWVLKPARSSGSKGIFIVRSQEELAQRLPETLAFGPRALVEAFVPGVQLTCEGLLRDGAVVASWVTRRETAPAPWVATWGHTLPSGLDPQSESAVLAAVLDVMRRLDVRDGPFDADVVWDGERCFVLEATPRLGGNSLSRLIETASGFDLVDEAVRCACGEDFGLHAPPPTRPTAVVLLGATTRGHVRWDEAAASALRAEPWVKSLAFDRSIGDEVEPFLNGRHRVGEAIIVADEPSVLERRYAEIRERLAVSAS